MREQVQQIPGELGARLRALRHRYPTLAISTEIIHHTDRLIAFRATIAVDMLVRAQGHAAQRTEPTGAFVTAAETLAVEQALLLGGFDLPHDDVRGEAGAGQELPAPQTTSITARAATDMPPARKIKAGAKPTVPLATVDLAEPLDTDVQVALPTLMPSTSDEASPISVDVGSGEQEAKPLVTPRPKRDRQAERIGAKAQTTSTTPAAATEANAVVLTEAAILTDETTSADTRTDVAEPMPAPAPPPVTTPTNDEVVSIHPLPAPLSNTVPLSIEAPAEEPAPAMVLPPLAPTPPATPRRSRARSVATASAAAATPAVPVATDTPTTRETLRAAWQVGRPIPAWWPQSRTVVTEPISKTRVGRLRALALDEEISTSLLDTYSTLLFGVAVAGLDQAQSMILEERLNPAYPSPLEELRVRRILHPLAVSDAMTIPEDHPFFIRWSDVPPVEEAPEPVAPPTISWRERGKKGSGRRR